LNNKKLLPILTRRDFFQNCAGGVGSIALAQLLLQEGLASQGGGGVNPLAPRTPHFAGQAKNVIFLFMAGAPSQLDLFDPKPELQRWHGTPLPPSITKDLQLAFIKSDARVLASPRVFKRYGQSGIEMSDYLPHLSKHADDICLIRSMVTDAVNHHPAQSFLQTGSPLVGRPTLGAWTIYGLGSESQDLPGFVVLPSGRGTSGGVSNWASGFMPTHYSGVPFRAGDEPIPYLSNPEGINAQAQSSRLKAINDLNMERYLATGDREIASRMAAYELAFRMQMEAPKILDFSDESPATMEMYGVDQEPMHDYARNCLMARRLVERDVRFVMLAHASWDDHDGLDRKLKKNCEITDQPVAALLKDLKQRGLLDETLVIWGGEFGRTPMGEGTQVGAELGRDHHPNAFSMWMAGGGIKGGQVIGETDVFGLEVVKDPVHIHDLHATILHCLGFDHTRLTYRHQGRAFRLTDVAGEVVHKALI
jgi:hypothetical protein